MLNAVYPDVDFLQGESALSQRNASQQLLYFFVRDIFPSQDVKMNSRLNEMKSTNLKEIIEVIFYHHEISVGHLFASIFAGIRISSRSCDKL